MRRRTPLATGSALALLVATAASTSGAGAGTAEPPSNPGRLSAPAFVTNGKDEVPGHSYTSPIVVADPDDPRRLYAAAVEIRTEACVLLRSSDAGRSWTRAPASPAPAAFPKCTHDNGFVPMSAVALGRDDTLYYFHIGWDAQDGGRSENRSVFLARTRDFGETWESTPVNVNRGKTGNDIEKNVPADLVVDTSGDRDVVVVSYTASYPNPSTPPTRPNQPFVATSVDGGRTFGPPVNVAASWYDNPANLPPEAPEEARKRENFGGSGTNVAVDGKGTIYAAWNRSQANVTPAAPPSTQLARSTDQGRTWTSTVLHAGNANPTGPGNGFQLLWSPGGGDDGSLHAVWEGRLTTYQGDRDVLYRRSLDEGRTWSEPRLLNDDDPNQYFAQYQPNIAVAPNGRLEVVWWDFRESAGLIANDVFATTSTDSGATWSRNFRVTDQLINRRIGVWKPGFGGDVRQPPGVAASDRLTVVVWDDTRHGDVQTETTDLYAATVQYQALPRTAGLAPGVGYALAAVLGVVGVGLIMVLVAAATRGRRSQGPAAPAHPGREPVGVG